MLTLNLVVLSEGLALVSSVTDNSYLKPLTTTHAMRALRLDGVSPFSNGCPLLNCLFFDHLYVLNKSRLPSDCLNGGLSMQIIDYNLHYFSFLLCFFKLWVKVI